MNDANRMRFENDQFYMKTEEEMREALKDFPEACDTTVEVAEKCDVVLERDSILPRFPLPEGETEESWFRKRVQEGLVKRYGDPVPPEAQERADYEMSVIIQQGFPAYFLIVQEYIEWARSQGIGVGPGRGSAAGAIVAYAMGITALDPLSNGLLFERFLSPERVEMPDIDVDFEQGRREEVINHIKDVYGEDHVSQVITFGTLQAKNAVRDAARVLDYPYSTGDRICKMIGDELGITIDKALDTNPDLKKAYETEEDVKAGHRRREVHRGPRARRGRARVRHHHLPRPHERPRAHEARHQGRRHHHPVRRPLHARAGPAEDGLPRPAHARRADHGVPQRRAALRHEGGARGDPHRRRGRVRAHALRQHGRPVPGGGRAVREPVLAAATARASPTSSPPSRSTVRARWSPAWWTTT